MKVMRVSIVIVALLACGFVLFVASREATPVKLIALRDAQGLEHRLERDGLASVEKSLGIPLLHFIAGPKGPDDAAFVAIAIKHGADPNKIYWHSTPLMEATIWTRPNIVEALLAAGADPNIAASDGRRAKNLISEGNRKVDVDRLHQLLGPN